MHTPSDPTAALAALIAGNQRHINRRAEGRRASTPSLPAGAVLPFAITIEVEPVPEALTELFDVSPEQVQAFVLSPDGAGMRSGRFEVVVPSDAELVRVVEGSIEPLGCALIVVLARLARLDGRGAALEASFARSEHRAFALARRLLGPSARVTEAIGRGRLRMVAAIFDEQDGRVHWLGEHPEQGELVGRARGSK
ncbi:MAG: hypothetical protein ACOYMM_05345 [Phycisphaerales bacterium]|jgi:hypothetical protein